MSGRIENLRPFKPGESGNPSGRPKGVSVAKRLMRLLEGGPTENPVIECKADIVALKLFRTAVDGDVQAIRTILAYTDGTPVQVLSVMGADERTPLQRHLEELNGEGPPPGGGEITQAARKLLTGGEEPEADDAE